jgi:PPM family protein phosphatase
LVKKIKHWFQKEKKTLPIRSAAGEVATSPLSVEQIRQVTKVQVNFQPDQLLIGTAQSTGRHRDHNEDSIFAMNTTLATGKGDTQLGVFIVADGMGGHQNGEIASEVAVQTMAETLIRKVYIPFLDTSTEKHKEKEFRTVMETAMVKVHTAVLNQVPGGGTTITAALIYGEQMTIGHVGDSRAYILQPDGRIHILTKDHSLVHRLVELGQITEKEASEHPQRNILYRAAGQNDSFEADVEMHKFSRGNSLLLCSDGLWGVINDQELFRIVRNAKNPSLACKELVDAANRAGGPDNISVILVQYLA